jgi:hypothetical protein
MHAARPSIDEVMANISARTPVNYTVDDVRSLTEDVVVDTGR